MPRSLKVKKYTTWIFVISLYLLLFSTGCTQNHVLKQHDIELSGTIIEPLPLKIGVYYPNESRTVGFGGDVFHIGESSVALFNKLLTKMFKKVVEVQGTNGQGYPYKDLDVILELKVQRAYFCCFQSSDDKLMLTYRFTFYTPSGELLTSWATETFGSGPGEGTYWDRARAAMNDSLINAEKDFVVNCRMELAKHPSLFFK